MHTPSSDPTGTRRMSNTVINISNTPKSANDRQVGGDHYKIGGEEHWDRVYRLFGIGYFVGCITKYVERFDKKNGLQDLQKAGHYLQKLMEVRYGYREEKPVADLSEFTSTELMDELRRRAHAEEIAGMDAHAVAMLTCKECGHEGGEHDVRCVLHPDFHRE